MSHWIKFNVVGALGFTVQSGTLYLLTHEAHHIHYLTASVVAIELAVLNNFVWHQRWTWSDRPSSTAAETLHRLAKFNATNGIVSVTGSLVLMTVAVGWLGIPVGVSNLLSVGLCSLCNYFLADRISFNKH